MLQAFGSCHLVSAWLSFMNVKVTTVLKLKKKKQLLLALNLLITLHILHSSRWAYWVLMFQRQSMKMRCANWMYWNKAQEGRKEAVKLILTLFIRSYAKQSETALLSLTCYFLCVAKLIDAKLLTDIESTVNYCLFVTLNNAGLKSKTKKQFINYQAFYVWSRMEIHFCISVYSVTYSLHVMQIILYPVRWHKGHVVLINMHHLLIVRTV